MSSIATIQGDSLQGTNITIATGTVVGKKVKSILIGNKTCHHRYIRITIGGKVIAPVRVKRNSCRELVELSSGVVLESGEKFEIAAFKDVDFSTAADANDVGYHGWCEDCDDGSGGGGGSGVSIAPGLPTFSNEGTAADLSSAAYPKVHHAPFGLSGSVSYDLCKWSNTSVSLFVLDQGDSQKLKHVRLSFSANGDLSSESSTQNLGSDYTGASGDGILVIRKSATRCVVVIFDHTSTRGLKVLTYDLSGDTVSLHGSVQSKAYTNDATSSAHARSACSLDDDHIVVFGFNATSSDIEGVIFKHTTSQAVGSWTTAPTSCDSWGRNGACSYDPDAGEIIQWDGHDQINSWTYVGTVLTHNAVEIDNVPLASHLGEAQTGSQLFKHDIESGRMLNLASYVNRVPKDMIAGEGVNLFSGTVTQNNWVLPINSRGEISTGSPDIYYQRNATEVAYDGSTHWGEYVAVARKRTRTSST